MTILHLSTGEWIYLGVGDSPNISSTNYPSNYNDREDFTWLLQTETGYQIQLTFLDFNTESGFDRLRGGDGNDASKLQLFDVSGYSLPSDKRSNGRQMWLRFTSDGSVTRRGFLLVARSIPAGAYLFQ